MKKYSIYGLFVCIVSLAINNSISAQVDPSYRQYRFNALVLNPAHAGSNEYSDVSVLGSQYWVGMPGAPQTATISGNFKVMDNFGIGATVVADESGPVHSTNVSLVGAYHLKLSNKWKFSTGLKLSAINHNVLTSELQTSQSSDPDMQENLSTGLSFNAGFGFLVYSKKLYFGFSKPRVGNLRFNRMDMGAYIDKKSGYIAYSGADLKISETVEFRPSVMALFGHGGPLSLDMNAVFTMNNLLDLGVTYNFKGSVGAIIGLNIQDKLYIGYSYVYPMNRMNTVSIQSHELGLRLKFGKVKKSGDSPRFFN